MKLQMLIGKNEEFFGKKSIKKIDVKELVYELEEVNKIKIWGYSITNAHQLTNSRMGRKNNLLLELDLSNGDLIEVEKIIYSRNYHTIETKRIEEQK